MDFSRILVYQAQAAPHSYLGATEDGKVIISDHDDGTGRQRWNILAAGSAPIQETSNPSSDSSAPEPMDVKSISCGTLNVTRDTASCPAATQHAACRCECFLGSCTPRCEFQDGAAIHARTSPQGPSCSIAPNPNYFCKLGNEPADAAAHGDGGCWAGRCASGFHPVCTPAKCEPPVSHMSSCGCAPN